MLNIPKYRQKEHNLIKKEHNSIKKERNLIKNKKRRKAL